VIPEPAICVDASVLVRVLTNTAAEMTVET